MPPKSLSDQRQIPTNPALRSYSSKDVPLSILNFDLGLQNATNSKTSLGLIQRGQTEIY
jgi:hypothetical protein